jgi:NAD(P)-dependent dehydrogenase (short-subunit alcohol dehydrogenase family)
MQRVLVTGAAKGIGRAVAEAFAAEGAALVLMDVDGAGLAEVGSALAGKASRIETVIGSVAKASDCEAAAALAQSALGGLDVLSHNAGIQRYGTVETTPEEVWDEVFDVNLKGAYLMSKAVMPMLRASRGSVVHMASVQGFISQSGVAAYAAAKHGLIGLVRSMAVDYAPLGVRVNGVAPGSVDTPMLRSSVSLADDPEAVWAEIRNMHPLGRAGNASEVANAVVFLASEKASFITGDILRVDGALTAHIPGTPKKQ